MLCFPIDLPIGPIDPATNAIDPNITINFSRDPTYSQLDPPDNTPPAGVTWIEGEDCWSHCYEPSCTIEVRQSHMRDDDKKKLTNFGLGITHRSRIMIPNAPSIPLGQYYLGTYVGPMKEPNELNETVTVEENNLENNATYMELRLVNLPSDC